MFVGIVAFCFTYNLVVTCYYACSLQFCLVRKLMYQRTKYGDINILCSLCPVNQNSHDIFTQSKKTLGVCTVVKSGALLRGGKQFGIALDVKASLPSVYLDSMMARTATVSGTPTSTKYFFLCVYTTHY